MIKHLEITAVDATVSALSAALVVTVSAFGWRNWVAKRKLRIIAKKLMRTPDAPEAQTEIKHLLKTFPLETSVIGKPRWELTKLLNDLDSAIGARADTMAHGSTEAALTEHAETFQPGLTGLPSHTERLRALAGKAKALSERFTVLEFI